MLYKVWSKDSREHLWTYHDFKAEVGAETSDFEMNGSKINYIVYEVDQEIDLKVFRKYGFNYKKLPENRGKSGTLIAK